MFCMSFSLKRSFAVAGMHAQMCLCIRMCVHVHACRFPEVLSTHVPAFTAYGDKTGERMRRLLFFIAASHNLLLRNSILFSIMIWAVQSNVFSWEQPAWSCFVW